MGERDDSALVLAASLEGDRWLCADQCAVLLGMFTPAGKINRRGFLERIAIRSSFPKPLQLGGEKKWKRSEVMQWAENERRAGGR